MKKIILTALALFTALCLIACTAENPPADPSAPQESTTPTEEVTPAEQKATEDGEGEDLKTAHKTVTDLQTLEHLAEDDPNCAHIYAFLTADADGVTANLPTNADPEAYETLKSIKISEFCLTIADTYNLDFTVTESGCETFGVGEHSYTYSRDRVNFWKNNDAIDVNNRDDLTLPHMMIKAMADDVLDFNGGNTSDETLTHHKGLVFAMMMANNTVDTEFDGLAEDGVKKSALELFGLEDYQLMEGTYNIYNGAIYGLYLSGDALSEEYTEIREDGDKVTFVKQMYSDALHIIPSHKVEYTFTKADNTFGWRLEKVECVKNGEYPPLKAGL